MIFFYIPTPNEPEARKIVRYLLKKKIIACANIFPANSLYRLQGKITNEHEVILLLKTEKKLAKQVEAEVKKIHPYSIPCIAQLPVKVNKEYKMWVKRMLKYKKSGEI